MTQTLIGLFLETVARHRKPSLFMRKLSGRWESISAERTLADVERLALGLGDLGVQRGDHVAILSENRYEWPVADLAILGLGAVSVPIYPTLTAQQVRYILENSEAKVVIASTPAQLAKLHAIVDTLPRLTALVHMDPAPESHPKDRPLDAIMRRGAEKLAREPQAFRQTAQQVKSGDLATIIYTSGTTGEPKGAMLSHHNVVSNVTACLETIGLGSEDTSLSFLPLCHILERMAGLYAMLKAGVTIAYAESIDTVAANAVEVRPTVMTGVPRFYEKVYARVMENALSQPPIRRNIFFWGLHAGEKKARAYFAHRKLGPLAAFQARIADRLVGAKIRARVGGRLRFCVSGGAPLSGKLLEFFFAVGIPIVEGYGLTETSPVICLNRRGNEKPGSVGPPIPGVEVRIGTDGEILTRGPHVMLGYFKNEEATRQSIRDGWFHTGDVGYLDSDGMLVITDRIKDLLVTAGGKKIAPQPLEARLKQSKFLTEAVLLGDQRPYVVCLLVPNFATLEGEARTHGWKFATHEELLALPEVNALYQKIVDGLNVDLAPFEQIKYFALLGRDLSQDAGELTPTFKVRRRVVAERFADVISKLYSHAPAHATNYGRA
jgi:long-chain acyl-CoA synthetase